jgi:stage II sporulation protein AA (anti-sigma F factor antagonist)
VIILFLRHGRKNLMKINHFGDTMIVRINSDLDHHVAEIVRIQIDSEYETSSAKNIIFDFSDTNFMDSSGIGVIIGRYKNAVKRDGKTYVVSLGGKARWMLKTSGVLRYINEFDTVDKALNSLQN